MMKTALFPALTCLIMGMSLPSLHAAEKAAPKETTVIIAEGVGINADKALLKALRNAVQQVVGVIIDAETLIKNEKVVKDEILDFSNGFVEKFEKIKEGKDEDGLYEMTIKATVKRRQLIERLQKAKVYTGAVAGKSLFGSVVSEMEAQKKGAVLLKKTLEDLNLPYSLLKAEAVSSQPKVLKKSDNSIVAGWIIRVQYDIEKYQKVVLPKLKQVLDDIAMVKVDALLLQTSNKVESGLTLNKADGEFANPFGIPASLSRRLEFATFQNPRKDNPVKGGVPVFLFEKWIEATKQQWYRVYWVDTKSALALKEFLSGLGRMNASELQMKLVGSNKKTLFTEDMPWADGGVNSLLEKGGWPTLLGGRYTGTQTEGKRDADYFRQVKRPTLIKATNTPFADTRSLEDLGGDIYRANSYYIVPFMRVRVLSHPERFSRKVDIPWEPTIPLAVLKDVVGIEVKIQPFKARNR